MDNNQVILLVLSLVVGAIVPFVQEPLNNYFKANGEKAVVLAGVLSAVVAVVILVITGQLNYSQLTFDNFVRVFPVLLSTGQLVFQLVKEKLGWTK